jgi:site-specific DNA-methyltransferase (adenine-specific)
MRDVTERVIVASKGRFNRAIEPKRRAVLGLPHESTISKDEFFAAALDVWDIRPESARRVKHPAPFPVQLPERLIQFHTYVDDVVLDPFLGSGSTAIAAARTNRHYVGYDTDQAYIDIAEARIASETSRFF